MKVLLASTILATVTRSEDASIKVIGGPLEPLTPPNPTPEPWIWHGERDIATVVNQAGVWDSNYAVDNMFDDSATTLWHSSRAMQSKPKVIGFEFKVKTFSLRDVKKFN